MPSPDFIPCPCDGDRCKLAAEDHRHGSTYGYKKLYCRCDDCRDAQADDSRRYAAENPEKRKAQAARHYVRHRERILARNRNYHAHLRGTPTRRERYAQAEKLLQDGSGYREAARSVGVDHGTLADHFPGYGLAPAERGARAQLALKARAYDQGLDATRTHSLRGAELVDAAEVLAEVGSYAEAARRTGHDRATLAKHLPGRGYSPEAIGRHARATQLDRERGLAA